jgi:hypothetical protein
MAAVRRLTSDRVLSSLPYQLSPFYSSMQLSAIEKP